MSIEAIKRRLERLEEIEERRRERYAHLVLPDYVYQNPQLARRLESAIERMEQEGMDRDTILEELITTEPEFREMIRESWRRYIGDPAP